MSDMAAHQQQQHQQKQQLEGIHKHKISPPRFTGEYNTFEAWKYKMTAHLGLQDPAYKRLLRQSEQSQLAATNDQLETAAPSQAIAEQWIQLSNNLRYPLVSACDGPASTIRRQNMQCNGFETWRLTHARYSIPLGTRSIGYLTRLLKPQLDEQKFEESFATWGLQLSRYEQDNNTPLPDAVKTAILLNETKGPLQQHLQLQAGNITTYAQIRSMMIEYYRATASLTRLQAIASSSNQQRLDKEIRSKDNKDMAKEKDTATKERAKDTTTTNKEEKEQKGNTQRMFATDADNQDTWPNNAEWRSTTATLELSTPMTRQTDDWCNQAHYDNDWYHQDQSQMHQLALPQPPQGADPSAEPISGLHEVTIAMISAAQQPTEDNKWVRLMIESGAATHVCPPWFAPQFPPRQLEHGAGPQLRAVTNRRIKLFGYRWVCVTNRSGQQIVIPFYICEVKQLILSVTRLVEQGCQLTLDDNPRLQRIKGFNSALEDRHGLFFLQAEITTLPKGTTLQTHNQFNTQENLSEHTGNSGRHFSHHQEHSVQSQQSNLRTTGKQPSNSRMVQRTRLRTSVAKQSATTDVERRNSIQDQERRNIARNTTATVCNKDTAKERATEGRSTRDPIQPTNAIERENNTTNTTGVSSITHRQRCSWTWTSTSFRSTSWRRLLAQRRPILEESTC